MWTFTKRSAIRKGDPLEKIKIAIIPVKWNAQGKGMILLGFLFYRSHVSRETGLLDRHRTIKRGSRLSFSVSVGESSNLCILAFIIFLGSYLAFLLVRFLVLVVIFMTSPSSPKTDFVWKTCCVFGLEILSVYP